MALQLLQLLLGSRRLRPTAATGSSAALGLQAALGNGALQRLRRLDAAAVSRPARRWTTTAASPAASPAPPESSHAGAAAARPTRQKGRQPGRPWTKAEDETVLRGVETHGHDWAAIARLLVNRESRKVRQRYMDTLRHQQSPPPPPWTPEDDELLARVVQQLGTGRWTAVAELLPPRTAKQCSQRWYNHVRQAPSREPWTPAEDEKLKALAARFGRQWRKIADNMPNRSPLQCRWRLETALSPDRKEWTQEDSTRLLELFQQHGPQWAQIARTMRIRSDYELRKIFLREYRPVYLQWLKEHDVVRREAEYPATNPGSAVRHKRGRASSSPPAAAAVATAPTEEGPPPQASANSPGDEDAAATPPAGPAAPRTA